MSFVIPDAPAEDELLVAVALATSGRPHARIGDRYQDMKRSQRGPNRGAAARG